MAVKQAQTKKYDRVRLLTYTAVLAALTFALTMVHIAPAANAGYSHLGDAVIYLSASILPWPYAMLSASVGGALADLVSGSANWAIATIIIKALNVVPFALMRMWIEKCGRDRKILSVWSVPALLLSGLVTFFGYLLAEMIMYGTPFAMLASVSTGWIQPVFSTVVFVVLALALDRADFKKKIQISFKK